MIDRVREQILGYLLGILDDSERERVEACLERDPEYQRQWAELRRQLAQFEAEESDAPPPGLARRGRGLARDHRCELRLHRDRDAEHRHAAIRSRFWR